jgi:hypothetical protein
MGANTLIENAYQKAYATTLMSADVPTCFGQQPEREELSRYNDEWLNYDYEGRAQRCQELVEQGYAIAETRTKESSYSRPAEYQYFTWTPTGMEFARGLGYEPSNDEENAEGEASLPFQFIAWRERHKLADKAAERARLEAAQLAKCANCLFFSQCAVISGKFKRASYGGDY